MVWTYSIATNMKISCLEEMAAHAKHMLLGYCKSTRKAGLMFLRRSTPGGLDPVHAFAAANFAQTNSASHGGSVYLVDGNLATCKSKRHSIVTTSTAGPELVETVDAHFQRTSAEQLLAEMNHTARPFVLARDNIAMVNMVGDKRR